jgi:hypothetical protein
MDGCAAVFGDPSSCARHRKERHRIIGAYQCPVSRCKSRYLPCDCLSFQTNFGCSIKRRSAFMQHLRKHKIDPATVDLNALAPTLLPRQIFERRKPQPSLPIDIKLPNASNISYPNNIPYTYSQFHSTYGPILSHRIRHCPDDIYSNAPSYNSSSHPYIDHYTTDDWFSSPRRPLKSLGMLSILADELHTISAAPSPPELDFSMSPSPTPSRSDLVRTPEVTQLDSISCTAPHSLCTSPNSALSPYFFSWPGHQKQPNWDADTLLFGNSVMPQF